MKYSVLASVYYKENPEYLKLSILSIINQTVPTDDFVIVKDGPLTDELEETLSQFKKKYSNINIVDLPENIGLGAALNAGLIQCSNELIARMDTDDIALEYRCELQLLEFIKDHELDIVGSYMYEFTDNPENITAVKSVPITHSQIYSFGKRRNPFNHPTVMFKKSSIVNHGGYSTMRRGEDFELFTRLLYCGCKGRNIDKPLLKFRANKDMHRRRKSWLNVKTYIEVIYESWKMGYADFIDLLYAFVTQMTLFIIPTPIGRWIYRYIFRYKPS